MTEICAAMGLTTGSLDDFIAFITRTEAYGRLLGGLPGVRIAAYHGESAAIINTSLRGGARMRAHPRRTHPGAPRREVLARRYFHASMHRMEPYRSLLPTPNASLLLLGDRAAGSPDHGAADRPVVVRSGHRARVRDPAHGARKCREREGAARAEVRSQRGFLTPGGRLRKAARRELVLPSPAGIRAGRTPENPCWLVYWPF